MANPDVQTAVAAQAQSRAVLVANLTAQVGAMLASFNDWYSDAAVAELADRIAGIVSPTQRVAASQADAFLSQIATMSGRTFRPVGPVDVTQLRHGVTTPEAYARLGETFRFERSQGATDVKALSQTYTRASVMNDTDIALAIREQAQAFMKAHAIDSYRRVIHPELARGGTCGMCIKASQSVVPVGQALALHGRCHCTEVPIIGHFDPAHELNKSDIASLRSQGLPADGERFRIAHHAELGPTLTPQAPSTRQA